MCQTGIISSLPDNNFEIINVCERFQNPTWEVEYQKDTNIPMLSESIDAENNYVILLLTIFC